MRILLAEDNPTNQVVLRTMIELSGLSTDIVSNGREAIDAVSKIPYNIVLMDVSMPEVDGVEATHRIRKMDSPAKDVVIIALTAHALCGDKEHFINQGMDDFISKPVTRQSLLDCLAHWQHEYHLKYAEKVENTDKFNHQVRTKQEPLVEETTITQLVADTSAEAVPSLITCYIEDAKMRIIKLATAAHVNDYYTLKFEAHTLCSSAAAYGNSALAQLCRNIERLCLEQKYDQAIYYAALLDESAADSLLALEQRLHKGLTT
ncbi:response regulator [Candidatus Enterovibrio escicola]|uniref:response regulator n=1 Tax=Candidatus Enterovibrio escicola TaxID=1927127 RepID=UPI001237B49B|nr:response regulator [Candidatus Enterovibrio escacola]